MRRARIIKELTLAVGVAAGVIAIGFIVLIGAGPALRRPRDISNICVLDRVLVFERSAVGRSANSQLLQIKQRYQESINAEKRTIDQTGSNDVTADRMSQLAKKVQGENALLEGIRDRARKLVIQRIAPEIKRQAAYWRCATIVDRSAIVDLGQATDITPSLVKAIDTNVPPLSPGTLEK
jgi:Skp family chaperone for outer membrane proteins